jgi:hypothetical protein
MRYMGNFESFGVLEIFDFGKVALSHTVLICRHTNQPLAKNPRLKEHGLSIKMEPLPARDFLPLTSLSASSSQTDRPNIHDAGLPPSHKILSPCQAAH